jgi:DNA-binding MarR family transcriptional regulator/GNAT superfamily N-acetyltransferase
MENFYERTGKMALGSRLRRLSEQITEQAAAIYGLYEVDLQPKWFPVLYALSGGEEKSIMDIAREIGHTHPSVSQIAREMVAKGYIAGVKGGDNGPGKPADGRKNFVVLSAAGRALLDKMQPQLKDVQAAIENTMKETDHDLWKAIAEWEFLLEQKSLLRRVQEEKKLRESGQVQIVDYTPDHRAAFRQLNEEWITKYFRMEESDYKSLDHPQENILDKGGHIFMAMHEGKAIGTCALIPMQPVAPANPPGPVTGGSQHIAEILSAYPGQVPGMSPAEPVPAADIRSTPPALVFELAKMGVSPLAQGRGIGFLLGQACIEKARALGAERIYLESNTRLKPAISLYHKLGFRKVAGPPSPYERCNIQMELRLK